MRTSSGRQRLNEQGLWKQREQHRRQSIYIVEVNYIDSLVPILCSETFPPSEDNFHRLSRLIRRNKTTV
jgi:hypothetical protein